jgi:hypothetical protein
LPSIRQRAQSRNLLNNPVESYDVTDACGTTVTVQSADPGILRPGAYAIPLVAELLPPESLCIFHPAFFVNMFKDAATVGGRADRSLLSRQLGEDPRGRFSSSTASSSTAAWASRSSTATSS